jgi:hypothetical protein
MELLRGEKTRQNKSPLHSLLGALNLNLITINKCETLTL